MNKKNNALFVCIGFLIVAAIIYIIVQQHSNGLSVRIAQNQEDLSKRLAAIEQNFNTRLDEIESTTNCQLALLSEAPEKVNNNIERTPVGFKPSYMNKEN